MEGKEEGHKTEERNGREMKEKQGEAGEVKVQEGKARHCMR